MDNLVVENDFGDLDRCDRRNRYCSRESAICIGSDVHNLVVGPSPWECSEDIND